MHYIDFKIKILTPLYMFGADPKWLELRESSFKGMIRFWWRAVKCCDDYQKLKKIEESLFGGVSNDGNKSKVHVLITSQKTHVSNNLEGDYSLEWDYKSNQKRTTGKHSGVNYLLYSMLQKSFKKKIYPKNYFKPGGTFNISFYSRDKGEDRDKAEEALKNAVAAFWCAIYLGGFGSRSRRGAGSLAVEEVKGDTYGIDFIAENCKNREELIQWIERNIKRISEIIKPIDKNCRGYSNISNGTFIISEKGYSTWYDALAAVGNQYAEFRCNNRSYIQSGVFGLPIMHLSDSTKVEARINREFVSRRASPLTFKILQAKDGYYWMALKFAGDFLPRNAELIWYKQVKKTRKKEIKEIKEAITSLGFLNGFWKELKTDNGGEHKFSL